METIKNYLETMFMNLPNTPEVRRAKDELWQMMEDKFTELIEAGKTENEAVGTVISEFGNLSELADVLGIDDYVNKQAQQNADEKRNDSDNKSNFAPRMLTAEEVKNYLHDRSKHAFMVALGTLLCIISITGPIVSGEISDHAEACGVLFMFMSIAIGVCLFVFSGIKMGRWKYMKKMPLTVDFATYNKVKTEKERYGNTFAALITIGVLFCCICFVPAAVIDDMNIKFAGIDIDDLTGAMLFVLVGIGVFLIILGTMKNNSFERILCLNNVSTMGGNYKAADVKKSYTNKTVGIIMSVYWQSVTCLYLIWSFLTFDWHISWIIWPVAAVVQTIINNIFKEDN